MDGLLSEPLVQMAIAGAIGFALAEWRRGRDAHTKAVQVDTNLLARLAAVETWQRDHNTIHGCVQRLAATSEAMAKNVDRLTRRIDMFMSYFPLPQRQGAKPYEFPGARDWINADLEPGA